MPRTARRRSRRRSSSGRTTVNTQKVQDEMMDLIDLQRQQLRFGAPNVRDVEFPRMKQHVYTMVGNCTPVGISGSTTAAVAAGLYFSLASLPNYTILTGCFDRYRVLYLQFQFQPVSVSATGLPLCTAIDYDDSSTPSGEIYQRDTAMVTPLNTYFERTCKPRMALAVYSGSFTSYANHTANEWVDSGSPNVQYYGLKYYLPMQSSAVQLYTISVRCLLQFKNNF